MKLHTGMLGLVVLTSVFPPAEALSLYDPAMCFILDGFLGLYGLIITGMFIKERFFRSKVKASEDSIYSDLNPESSNPRRRDPERGKNRRPMDNDSTYTGLTKRTEDEYRELPLKKEGRQRKGEQLYQGLSSVTKDTYDSLQMKQLSSR